MIVKTLEIHLCWFFDMSSRQKSDSGNGASWWEKFVVAALFVCAVVLVGWQVAEEGLPDLVRVFKFFAVGLSILAMSGGALAIGIVVGKYFYSRRLSRIHDDKEVRRKLIQKLVRQYGVWLLIGYIMFAAFYSWSPFKGHADVVVILVVVAPLMLILIPIFFGFIRSLVNKSPY